MRTRYVVNDRGELEARDGTVLGRVVSITIEGPAVQPLSCEPVGTIGVAFSSEEKQGGGVGEDLVLLPVPATEVWSTYVTVMKPRRTELDRESKRTIDMALKVATVGECQRAILGCAASDFHMGRDPQTRGKTYKQLSQILKGKRGGRSTREQIDFFIEIADKEGVTGVGMTAIDKAKLSRCKRAVMTAWEFPADDRAAEAGAEARLWLADHGIVVVMDGTGDNLGRPTFRGAS